MYPSALRLFKKFSLLVDEIDLVRSLVPPQERSKSEHLHKLYVRADVLMTQLKRIATG